jgi:hypothetical protein
MLTINDFTGFQKGGIVSLSTSQIMVDFNQLSVDFEIKDVREYTEPNGALHYTGYLLHSHLEADLMYMLMVRRVGTDFDMILYYLDTEGDVSEAGEIVLSEDGENFQERFDLALTDGDGNTQEVTWDQKGSGTFFGVEFSDGESEDDATKTITEYFTNDDCGGNPHAFLEWSGDCEHGWVELWMGHEVNLTDVQLYNA